MRLMGSELRRFFGAIYTRQMHKRKTAKNRWIREFLSEIDIYTPSLRINVSTTAVHCRWKEDSQRNVPAPRLPAHAAGKGVDSVGL